MNEQESKVVLERREKAERLQEMGQALFPNHFRPRISLREIRERFETMPSESLAKVEERFVVAGRIMSRRDYGKSTFFDLKDHSGRLQAYLRKSDLPDEEFELFKKLDLGDLVGIEGKVFRTRTNELTIQVFHLELVTKALLPLPEKYHDMNVELRYRQRYLDLIMNDRVGEVFRKRTKVLTFLRNYLCQRGFLEVETPMMQPIPGGATARPFETHHQALDMKLYLRIAPELYLKRLLVGGFDRVFEINRNFRNEGISTQHNPEFTMLEFYQAYASFYDLIDLSEEMLLDLVQQLEGRDKITYQGQEIHLARPWKRIRFHESLADPGGVPRAVLTDRAAALSFARELKTDVPDHEVHGKILTKIFDLVVEPKLIQPTFVTHYPADVSPLSRRNDQDDTLVDRFELFIAGREIANGFSELNDPNDQKERFLAQVAEREAGDDEASFMDEDYIRALMYGMPPAAGEGVGVDRVVMLLTDSASIKDVILFPHLRLEQ